MVAEKSFSLQTFWRRGFTDWVADANPRHRRHRHLRRHRRVRSSRRKNLGSQNRSLLLFPSSFYCDPFGKVAGKRIKNKMFYLFGSRLSLSTEVLYHAKRYRETFAFVREKGPDYEAASSRHSSYDDSLLIPEIPSWSYDYERWNMLLLGDTNLAFAGNDVSFAYRLTLKLRIS